MDGTCLREAILCDMSNCMNRKNQAILVELELLSTRGAFQLSLVMCIKDDEDSIQQWTKSQRTPSLTKVTSTLMLWDLSISYSISNLC